MMSEYYKILDFKYENLNNYLYKISLNNIISFNQFIRKYTMPFFAKLHCIN